MKKTLLTVAIALLASTTFAQTTNKVATQEKITSIRPADGSPVVFQTQEELNNKVAGKTEAIKEQIRTNSNNPEKVAYLRKELWRFENAIVKTK